MKLNLGSGGAPVLTGGWVNIDIWPEAPHVDILHDLNQPLPFEPGSIEEIRAFDVLEHFSYHDASRVLGGWISILQPLGVIVIRCPDFDELSLSFVERRMDYLRAIQLMFGGQATPYDYHYIGINWAWLSGQLYWWGCPDVTRLVDPEPWALLVRGVKGARGVLVRNGQGETIQGVGAD